MYGDTNRKDWYYMKSFKSRKGFTLIELLVVIGILAVLAAIAIPSVAGLIDRANVSADNTNCNEMTNAIERFASEYELYCQDIASGTLSESNLDGAQGRVYNVLNGATTRAEITALEKPATAGPETTGRAIYRDTKYPVNVETIRAIVENYTKTSSSTFEPKQSDMHYWYSPECGVVVVATPESSIKEKNDMIISGKDAKGKQLNSSTVWIDITTGDYNSMFHNNIIPEGGLYIQGANTVQGGEDFPTIQDNDVYEYGHYKYIYYEPVKGWQVKLKSSTSKGLTAYDAILEEINGAKVTSLNLTFSGCTNLMEAPQIPQSVRFLNGTFANCTSLVDASNLVIPTNIKEMGTTEVPYGTFYNCTSLKYLPKIPANEGTTMHLTFYNCKNLVEKPNLPSHVDESNVFSGCTQFGY